MVTGQYTFFNQDRKACMHCLEGQCDREQQSFDMERIVQPLKLRDNEASFIFSPCSILNFKVSHVALRCLSKQSMYILLFSIKKWLIQCAFD